MINVLIGIMVPELDTLSRAYGGGEAMAEEARYVHGRCDASWLKQPG